MDRPQIKALILEESKLMRTIFSGLLHDVPDIEASFSGNDPYEIYSSLENDKPDVVILSAQLPRLDSIELLKKLKAQNIPVIISAPLTREMADIIMKALEIHASNYIIKPPPNLLAHSLDTLSAELIQKIRLTVSHYTAPSPQLLSTLEHNLLLENPYTFNKDCIIGIGAYATNIKLVLDILINLPRNFPPIILSIDLPEELLHTLMSRFSNTTIVKIVEAKPNQLLKKGHVYLRPHQQVCYIELNEKKQYVAKLQAHHHNYKPLDTLFCSLAQHAKHNAVTLLLDLQNDDGLEGLQSIKNHKGHIVSLNTHTTAAHLPQYTLEITMLPYNKITSYLIDYCQNIPQTA